jgi:hypothetical protein
MGLFIISLITVGLVIFCFWYGTKDVKDPPKGQDVELDQYHDGYMVAGVFLTVLSIAGSILFSWLNIANVSRVAELEVFMETNKVVYITTATDTALILSPTDKIDTAIVPIQGSVERIGVGVTTAERLKELRDQVTRYNNDLATMRTLNKNFFIGWLYPNIPDKLKYIAIR